MAQVPKIDSNATGLRVAEEDSLQVVSGDEVWIPVAPNSYGEFGGENDLVASDPITDDHQAEKGVVVGREARAAFQEDLRYTDHFQTRMQGVMFADLDTNVELNVATVDGTGNDYEPAAGGDGYAAGDLLFAKGFDDAANNGLKVVTGTPGAASVPVTDTGLVDASTQTGIISKVGVQLTTGDATIDVSGTWPRLVTVAYDCEDLGVGPGDYVFVGGDATAEQFANAANNGFKRVRQVGTTYIEFDKSGSDMVTDTGTGKTIRIYTPRLLKNQGTASNIVRRSYNLERTLGAPDDASPAQIQSEYVEGGVQDEMSINMPANQKITVDHTFLGLDHTFRSGVTGVKAGTRPALPSAKVFNSSDHVVATRLHVISDTDEAPSLLFAYVTDLAITIKNNLSLAKAVGRVSGFEIIRGKFDVSGTMTAYFADVAAQEAVQSNSDVTLSVMLYQDNKGIVIDIPLMALGDGRNQVALNEAIMVPLPFTAARGTADSADYDHTINFGFFDYLPALAETNP